MRTAILIIALSLGLMGCEPDRKGTPSTQAADARTSNDAPSTPTIEARVADDGPMQPADTVSAEDLAVLDAALSHMAADSEFHSDFSRDSNGQRLLVHSTTRGGNAYVRRSQVKADSSEGNLPDDALIDLERRNNGPLIQLSGRPISSVRREGARLDGWSPTSPNVTLDDLDRFPKPTSLSRSEFREALKKAYPDVKAYVRVSLPGYSADGQQAVVRLGFRPTPHGASATYFLTKNAAGSWTVTWRKFAYYA